MTASANDVVVTGECADCGMAFHATGLDAPQRFELCPSCAAAREVRTRPSATG